MRIVGGAAVWRLVYRGRIIGTSVLQPEEGSTVMYRFDGKMREFRIASVDQQTRVCTLRKILKQGV